MNLRQRRKRKGFSRSGKEWEESIAEHIGKFIDRLSPDDIPRLASMGFCAWMGNEAGAQIADKIETRTVGAFTGLLGLHLATSPSMGATPPVTQIAGCAILASLGILNVAPRLPDQTSAPLEAVSPIWALARGVTGDSTAFLTGVSPLAALVKILGR